MQVMRSVHRSAVGLHKSISHDITSEMTNFKYFKKQLRNVKRLVEKNQRRAGIVVSSGAAFSCCAWFVSKLSPFPPVQNIHCYTSHFKQVKGLATLSSKQVIGFHSNIDEKYGGNIEPGPTFLLSTTEYRHHSIGRIYALHHLCVGVAMVAQQQSMSKK